MKTSRSFLFTTGLCTALLLAGGCNQQAAPTRNAQTEKLLEQVEAFGKSTAKFESRIAELEKTNRMLEGEVNVLKDTLTKQNGTDEAENLKAQVTGIVNNELSEMIARKFDEQSGGKGLTQHLLASSWSQQMVAYEERKAQEEEARREERRQQEEERRAEMQAARFARMAEDLAINDAQAEQLQVAQQSMREQATEFFAAIREEGGIDRDTIRDQMTKLREEHLAATGQFLSEEQQTAYAEMSERGGFTGGFGGGGPGRGRGGPRGGGR